MAVTSVNQPDDDTAGNTGAFRAQPPTRQRVADYVFESLARGILKGELKPGEPVPTQRDLAKQFNVSALVVRQAIHRLEDLGLVRVRQGSATIVLDPEESTDIRLLQLQLELSDHSSSLATSALELQALFMVPMLALAERRITAEELAELDALVDSLPPEPTAAQGRTFGVQFFKLLAKATRNELYRQQVRWWASLAEDLERRGRERRKLPRRPRPEFHRQLVRALAQGHGTPELYLQLVRPLLDVFDAERGVPRRNAPPAQR